MDFDARDYDSRDEARSPDRDPESRDREFDAREGSATPRKLVCFRLRTRRSQVRVLQGAPNFSKKSRDFDHARQRRLRPTDK